MTDRRIHPKDWHRVVQYASVEAIQAYLDTARADRRRAELQVTRLEKLLAERTAATATPEGEQP
jgi:hypothetical protein